MMQPREEAIPSSPSPPLPNINIRAPSIINSSTTNNSNSNHPPPPSTAFLTASPWRVTYSTLPMWKSKRNVKITYKALPQGHLDDLVTYQSLQSSTLKTVHGIDRPASLLQHQDRNDNNRTDNNNTDQDDNPPGTWSYHWRGTGWLMIASSHWEILGYGSVRPATDSASRAPRGQGDSTRSGEGNIASTRAPGSLDWAVTYFAKTLFTPAGIDVYSRPGGIVPEVLLAEIKRGLKGTGDETLAGLVEGLFLVRHDDDK